MRTINLILAILFTAFAALQYNDPDPWRWILMYGFVAAVCAFAAFGIRNKFVLWAGLATCTVWMAVWLPEFLNWVKMGSPNIAQHMNAETPYIEFTREFLGLLICGLALGWQLWQLRKK